MKKEEKIFKEINPWKGEEGRKKKPTRGDSIPPKTSIQSRVHSKPKIEGQEYIDMYIRTKEKERTEKYGDILTKRVMNISDTWKDLKKGLLEQEKNIPKVPKGGIEEEELINKEKKTKKLPNRMKKVDWNY